MQVGKFRDHLHRLYKPTKLYSTKEDQQIFIPTKFANLLLIQHVEKCSSKRHSLVAEMMSKGLSNVEDDQRYTTSNIGDIFNHSKNYCSDNGELILVDGAAGIGKTILCKEIAYRWACKELLADDQLILLIFLRDPNIQKINSIRSLIQYFYRFEKEADSICQTCAEYIFEVEGKNITMIFDGYDEIEQTKCEHDFLLHLMHKEILSQCRIVVTSRPIASIALQKQADLQVEILGFSEESRQSFIKSELSHDPNLLLKVTSCLKKNSTLNHICYIPFILSILVHIALECEVLPDNQTELYEKFIVVSVSHFLKKLGLLQSPISNLNHLMNFEYKQHFLELCKYAFIALLESKLVFTKNEIKEEFPQLSNASGSWGGLGLLKSAKYFAVPDNSDSISYNFIHLSIQEYLAAHYITTLHTKRQISILHQYFFVEKCLNMWILYIGLNKHLTALKHFLFGNKFYFWTRLSIKRGISQVNLKSNIQRFYLFQCLCELKNESVLTLADSSFHLQIIDLSGCIMSLKDIDILICLLDKSSVTDWIELNLSQCCIGDVRCIHLCRGICKFTHPISFNRVDLSANLLTVNSMGCIISMLIKCKTQNFCVDNNGITDDDSMMVHFVTKYGLAANSIEYPLSIFVQNQENLIFSQMDSETIVDFLTHKPFITGVYCLNCQIDDCVAEMLTKLIITYKEPLKLYFWNSKVSGNFLQQILSILPQHQYQFLFIYEKIKVNESSIVNFILSKIYFTFMFLSESFLMLHNSTYAHISHIIFANPMLSFKEIRTICLSDYRDDNVIIEVLDMLFSHCTTVSNLVLLNNEFTIAVLTCFINAIKRTNSLKAVLLHENNLAEVELYHIRNGFLKYCNNIRMLLISTSVLFAYNCSYEQFEYAVDRIPSLTALVLCGCCIKDNTAVVINNVIRGNSHFLNKIVIIGSLADIPNTVDILKTMTSTSALTHLTFKGNVLNSVAAWLLSGIISKNITLEEFHFSYNQLKLTDIKVIANALKYSLSLKELNMENNNMFAEVASDLAGVIKANTSLTKLWLNDNHFGSSIVSIVNALINHRTLKELNLCNNENKDESLSTVIGSVVASNNSIESLFLSNNNLEANGTIQIAKSLANISGLKAINIQSNVITEEAAEAIASVISNKTGLKELYLGYNQLQAGVIKIANALKTISSLKILDLADNGMCQDVANELEAAISSNYSLENLHLDNNNFESSMGIICKGCSNIHSLKIFTLSNVNITKMVVDDLAAVIQANLYLEWLSLSENHLEPWEFIVLAQELKHLKNLVYFFAYSINITSAVAEDLISVIENNTSLMIVSLGDNLLENSVLEIALSCTGLSNLNVLEISNNCVSYTKLTNLATNVNLLSKSLASLSMGGMTLSSNEHVYLSFIRIIKMCNRMYTKVDDIERNKQNQNSKKVSILCSEVLRMQRNREFVANYDVLHQHYVNYSIYISYQHKDKFKQIQNSNSYKKFSKEAIQKLSQVDSKTLILSLQIIRTLKVINLENNNIDKDAATQLADQLDSNNMLEQLWLRGNELYDKGASVVLRSLHNLSSLLILDLSFNHLSSKSADSIAILIANNYSMQQLRLDGNDLQTRGIVKIASALKKLSSLRILSLCSNGITDDAAEGISNVLTSNVLLVELLLGNNQLQATGVRAIAMALRNVLMLRKLDMCNNQITTDVSEELAVTLSNCTNLQQLFLSDNMLETEGTTKIANALKYINSLQVLTLSSNNITESAAHVLVDVLRNKLSLKIVLIGGNNMQTTGINLIVQMAKNIATLQLLDVSDNNVSEEEKENFKTAFAINKFAVIIV